MRFHYLGVGIACLATTLGQTATAQTGTIIVNIVLAPFLIFGIGPFPELGVSGAALSTFLAIVIGVVWISIYFIDATAYLRFHFASWAPQLRVWWDMLKIGLPAGAEFALMGVYMAVIYAITKPFGSAAQGGFTIGLRIVQSVFLPVVALALPLSAFVARLMRASLIEVMSASFIRSARARGLSHARIVIHHALKPALLPVVSYLGPATAAVLTGSLVVETIFGIPGMGRYLVQGALNRDYTIVMGMVIVFASLTILLNLLVDLLYGWLDPRIRTQGDRET